MLIFWLLYNSSHHTYSRPDAVTSGAETHGVALPKSSQRSSWSNTILLLKLLGNGKLIRCQKSYTLYAISTLPISHARVKVSELSQILMCLSASRQSSQGSGGLGTISFIEQSSGPRGQLLLTVIIARELHWLGQQPSQNSCLFLRKRLLQRNCKASCISCRRRILKLSSCLAGL